MFNSSKGSLPMRPASGAILRSRSRMRNVFAFLVLGLVLFSGVAHAGSGGSEKAGRPLDLNRATMDQLEALPGIGAVKAAAILAVRDSRGGFQTMEELEAVRGIGPALVSKLRPLVVLGSKQDKDSRKARK